MSPDIANLLSNRPYAFLAGREYFKHVRFVFSRISLWQIPGTLAAFWLLGKCLATVYAPLVPTLGIYLYGFLIGPIAEEGVRLVSLRTRVGIVGLGAGFAIIFPLIEASLFLTRFWEFDMLLIGLALRLLGILLHLYTHFILAYRLSFFGSRNRPLGSFASAVCIHGAFNAATSVFMWIVLS